MAARSTRLSFHSKLTSDVEKSDVSEEERRPETISNTSLFSREMISRRRDCAPTEDDLGRAKIFSSQGGPSRLSRRTELSRAQSGRDCSDQRTARRSAARLPPKTTFVSGLADGLRTKLVPGPTLAPGPFWSQDQLLISGPSWSWDDRVGLRKAMSWDHPHSLRTKADRGSHGGHRTVQLGCNGTAASATAPKTRASAPRLPTL